MNRFKINLSMVLILTLMLSNMIFAGVLIEKRNRDVYFIERSFNQSIHHLKHSFENLENTFNNISDISKNELSNSLFNTYNNILISEYILYDIKLLDRDIHFDLSYLNEYIFKLAIKAKERPLTNKEIIILKEIVETSKQLPQNEGGTIKNNYIYKKFYPYSGITDILKTLSEIGKNE